MPCLFGITLLTTCLRGTDFFGTGEFRDHVDDDRKDGRAPFCAESGAGSRRAIAARATPIHLSATNLPIPFGLSSVHSAEAIL